MRRWRGRYEGQRPAVIGGTVVAAAYAWWATGVAPFTALSYVAVAIPSLALVVAYGMARGLTPNRPDVVGYERGGAGDASLASTWPWLAIVAAAVALESVGLLLGGRSAAVPTLSTTVDHLLAAHWERFVLFGVWLSVGRYPVGRLAARSRAGAR